ncbi:MAG: transketolase [Candidatus Magasanikbacteria bacterium]
MIDHLHDDKLKTLEEKANRVRQKTIEMLLEAGSGHSAGPLGLADIFVSFYFHILNHDPDNPEWDERDRFILSNGHVCPALYSTLAYAGYFPLEETKTLRKLGSRLQGHPHREDLPGIETTSGPLGSGLSQAIGFALSANLSGEDWRTYCLTSDGEHDEGNLWEAVMYAGKKGSALNKLTVVVDRNNIQIDGYTEDVMPLEPLAEKYKAHNWHVLRVDGHNMESFVNAVNEAHAIYEKPSVIIAHTVPGKGVDYMERDYKWHGKPPGSGTEEEVPQEKQPEEALHDLRTLGGQIESEHE